MELMFKAATDGQVKKRVGEFIRSRGFPSWFTVTTSPKGSYREHDVIEFLDAHLPAVAEDKPRWRILLADAYKAHKTANVSNLAWDRGYVMMLHGGGATPVSQTPDTDLNASVRRKYMELESDLLLSKATRFDALSKATPEDCCLLMYEVLKEEGLHLDAAAGYKKTGQTVALDGSEDPLICREAGIFWNEPTTDGYADMRSKLNHELAAVADEFEAGGLPWCRYSVERLISPYPARPDVDDVLENMGEDFYHDDVHNDPDVVNDPSAVADGDSDADDPAAAEHDAPPLNDEQPSSDPSHGAPCAVMPYADAGAMDVDLKPDEAEAVHAIDVQIEALTECIESIRCAGAVSAAHVLQRELACVKRRKRTLVVENPLVADAFLQRRLAVNAEVEKRRQIAAEMEHQEKVTKLRKQEADAAVAELKRAKQAIADAEHIKESIHSMKTFTVDSLGGTTANAGGVGGRKRRFEVLDRMARSGTGLSPAQRNDWVWFKESWDTAMLTEHKGKWPTVFASWMQNVMNSGATNAFSVFVYDETRRLFSGSAALHVP